MCRFSSPDRFKYDLQSDVVFNVELTVTTDCHDNGASTLPDYRSAIQEPN
ncbi:hypothetical protein ACLOEE_08460 [Limosilactobacillus mucosae]